MSKFYAAKGENNKIFTDWEECKAYIHENKGYKHKSFHTREEAEAFLEGRDYYAEELANDLSEGFAVAFTDGSFEEGVGKYSYGVVAVSPDGKERCLSGVGAVPEFLPTRNIAGEVGGVLTAVRWAFLNGYPRLKIYHDYEGLSAWATGVWGTGSPISVYYLKELSRYKGVVDIVFKKVKGHSNHKYNEMVDALAKKALFEGVVQLLSGQGFKVSGTYFFDGMVSWLNKKSPRAKITERNKGVLFTYQDEKLGIFPGRSATGIVGSGGFLYSLALLYFLENHKDMGINRLIERYFDCEIDNDKQLDMFEVSRLAIEKATDRFASGIIFALSEIENSIRISLRAEGKISQYFSKSESGFSCVLDLEGRDKIETAYEFFYEYRTKYQELDLTKDQAIAVVERACELVSNLKRS